MALFFSQHIIYANPHQSMWIPNHQSLNNFQKFATSSIKSIAKQGKLKNNSHQPRNINSTNFTHTNIIPSLSRASLLFNSQWLVSVSVHTYYVLSLLGKISI